MSHTGPIVFLCTKISLKLHQNKFKICCQYMRISRNKVKYGHLFDRSCVIRLLMPLSLLLNTGFVSIDSKRITEFPSSQGKEYHRRDEKIRGSHKYVETGGNTGEKVRRDHLAFSALALFCILWMRTCQRPGDSGSLLRALRDTGRRVPRSLQRRCVLY